jgi:hypothetical protein
MSENLQFTEALQKEPVVVLTRYLEGELSLEESQQLEQVMAEDPFMADALEGLRSMPEPARAQAIGQELKFEAHKLLREKRPILSLYHFNQYATAAVAVLVILFVATAAILLTSRLQTPEAEVASAETVTEDPAGDANATDKLYQEEEATHQWQESEGSKDEDLNPQKPANESPALTEQRQPEIIRDAKPASEMSPTPPTDRLEPEVAEEDVANDFDDSISDLDGIVADSQSGTAVPGSPVTVESYDEIPTDPTLSKDQLESYRQAMTAGEYEAYRRALAELDKSLLAVRENLEKKTELQIDEIAVTRQNDRKERKWKKNNDSRAKQSNRNEARSQEDREQNRYNEDVEATSTDDYEVNENILKQKLYANPTDASGWLNLGKYYYQENQHLKAEPYLKAAARSKQLSVSQEAKELLEKINPPKKD